MATKLQCSSRFALLKVEDDASSDESDAKVKPKNQKSSQQTSSAKKRNKKKKKAEEDREKDELRNLAFGGSKSGHSQKKSQNSNAHNGMGPNGNAYSSCPTPSTSTTQPEQWEDWKRRDTENTMDNFEKDLQQAMMLSKLEYQERLQFVEATRNIEDCPANENVNKDSKRKKKKNVFTLDEFNKLGGAGEPETSQNINGPEHHQKVLNTNNTPTEEDKRFFDKVDEDASRAVRKEVMQDEYRKQYVVENARAAHYQKEIDKRDKEIAMLRASLRNMEDELKQVKKRNKQLCVILAQGEMKDKADVLMQLEELTAVKDELTDQLTDLSGQLEKERSKVHSLQKDLDKVKGGKHSKA